ncbi:methylated-DNA--[protein]-cysteine S-methyltransferase [Chloroflexus sp.]|uniref:methylated-DNA--[protein]-cysteine S-methyltransferase n=1 Tax=Chloroflexus sp. TaxID=1904827 RepID=UPI003C72CDCB
MQPVFTIMLTASPLGRLLVATTAHGLAAVFLGDDDSSLVAALRTTFSTASIHVGDEPLPAATAITAYLRNETDLPPLPLDLSAGTPFQQRVWRALQTIPRGSTRTYGQLVRDLGLPITAARAVGRACATNPLAIVVPCHRVLGADGKLHGFRWGIERKRALLALEGVLLPEG